MKYKTTLFLLLACIGLLASCAVQEACPVAQEPKPEYYFKKKGKMKYAHNFNKKRKPTPSLIHITRVNYKPNATR